MARSASKGIFPRTGIVDGHIITHPNGKRYQWNSSKGVWKLKSTMIDDSNFIGPQGIPGPTGATGNTGATGPAGTVSNNVTGDLTITGGVLNFNNYGGVTEGAIRIGEEGLEQFFNGDWSSVAAGLGSVANPAASAQALYDYGITTNGIYWINTSGGKKEVYCDFTDNKGWMLVASWQEGSNWTKNSTSSGDAFLTTAKNCFSSNFGDMPLNNFRCLVTTNLTNTGTSSLADWYYHWDTSLTWKKVWRPDGVEITTEPAHTHGYVSTTPRQSLKQFNHAYNLKYNLQIAQIFANLSDWGHTSATAGYLANWWSGLTTSGVVLGVFSLSKYDIAGSDSADGTFGLNASNANNGVCAGQDQNSNVKVGYDDGQEHRYYGGGNTTNTVNGQGADGGSSPMWLFIN
jgi:hypothetical protein